MYLIRNNKQQYKSIKNGYQKSLQPISQKHKNQPLQFILFYTKKYNNLLLINTYILSHSSYIHRQKMQHDFQLSNKMIKQPGNIYTNFQVRQFPQNANKKIRALVMGNCGNGKTLFLNKISGKNYQTGFARGSLTREIVYADSRFLPEGVLRIFDTPGTNSKKQALLHALILRRSLTTIPLNLILIQAKLDSRVQDITLTQLQSQLSKLKKYKHHVICLISHLDILESNPQQKQKTLQIFNQVISQGAITTRIILYSNISSDFQQLTKIFYNIGYDTKQQKIQIDDNIFFKNFNISDYNSSNQQIQKYVQQINNVSEAYLKYIKQLPQNQANINDIVSSIKIDMKHDLRTVQDTQYQQYSQKLGLDKSTDLYLLICQIIYGKLEELDIFCDARIKKQVYFGLKDRKYDVQDLLKKCPKCGIIWMRVQGCDGKTSCGGRPQLVDISDLSRGYHFKRIGDTLQRVQIKQQQISQQKYNEIYNSRQDHKAIGCKTEFVWKQQPKLQNIKQLLKQMYNCSDFKQIQLLYRRMMEQNQNKRNDMLKKVENATRIIQSSLGE